MCVRSVCCFSSSYAPRHHPHSLSFRPTSHACVVRRVHPAPSPPPPHATHNTPPPISHLHTTPSLPPSFAVHSLILFHNTHHHPFQPPPLLPSSFLHSGHNSSHHRRALLVLTNIGDRLRASRTDRVVIGDQVLGELGVFDAVPGGVRSSTAGGVS